MVQFKSLMVQEATGKIEQILDSAVKIEGKALDFYAPAEQTGTGSEQDLAHGLLDADFVARLPTFIFAAVTDGNTGTAGGIVEGTHDATNLKFTVPTGIKYKVFAL
jgi:hypothetical protein